MSEIEGLNISFKETTTNPNTSIHPSGASHNVFSSKTHNDSQSTIHSSTNQTNNQGNVSTLSMNTLQRENEILVKKIEYLQKIIKLKDNTIDDLNKKLISFSSSSPVSHPSSAAHSRSNSYSKISTNNVAISNNRVTSLNHTRTPSSSSSHDFLANLHPSPVKSIPEDNIDPLESSTATTSVTDNNTSPSIPPASSNKAMTWEIPIRNSNRTSIVSRSRQSSYQISIASPNPNLNMGESLGLMQTSELQSSSNTHIPRFSVSSITSSHYSENPTDTEREIPDVKHGAVIEKTNEKNEVNDSKDNDKPLELMEESTEEDDTEEVTENSTDSRKNLTLDLQNQLQKGDLTLGSSPRRSSSHRRNLSLEQALEHDHRQGQIIAQKIAKHGHSSSNVSHDNDEEDLHFGYVSTPSEPVYRKLGQDSLYSTNESLPIKTPMTDRFDNESSVMTPNSNTFSNSTTSNSITGTPVNIQSESTSSILHPSTTLQNNHNITTTAVTTPGSISTSTSNAPTLLQHPPKHPQNPPDSPNPPPSLSSKYSTSSIATSAAMGLSASKGIDRSDDSEKFLLNSLKHAVIRIESLIDPQGLSIPFEYISNHELIKSRKENYKISFLVYTDENPSMLTPIYRVKKSYIELLIMDKTVRPLVPSLPKLPDFQQVASLNFKYWAQSKKIIQGYINKLLSLLKSQNPLNQDNPIWKHFSNYFEFKMDPNDSLNDDDNSNNAEYSVLNLQNKICYLLYIRKTFTMKTYDFVKLIYNDDSNELIINFILSKSQEILGRDEVAISFKSQEIVIKKKKKFSANKSWSFYAESEYDANDLCSKVNAWIDSFSGPSTNNEDDNESVGTKSSSDGNSKYKLSNNSSNLIIHPEDYDAKSIESSSSPSINAPWKLFKKSSKQAQTSPRPPNNGSSPSTPSKAAGQLSSTPSLTSNSHYNNNYHHFNENSNSSNPFNDVLNFKAMPYESNKLTPENNLNANTFNYSNNNNSQVLKSPIRHMNEKPSEIVFQPIDESPKYFKSTLNHSYELCPKYKLNGFAVPSIVYQCITFLYHQSGEGFEGIFRLNGMMSEVNKIQEIFNDKYDCDLIKLTPTPDVHSIATLLKRYLRNLQDRLISSEVASELCGILNNREYQIKREEAESSGHELILSPTSKLSLSSSHEFKLIFRNKIPQLNRNVLFVLFKYLTDVLKLGKHNKMTISAMSVLVGPNLTQSDGGGQICTVLLENFNQIFV